MTTRVEQLLLLDTAFVATDGLSLYCYDEKGKRCVCRYYIGECEGCFVDIDIPIRPCHHLVMKSGPSKGGDLSRRPCASALCAQQRA